MTNRPLVTIGIPTFNRIELLKRSIASVLKQTYSNIEIVVCDNSFDDNTKGLLEFLTDPRVKYFKNEKNLGMVENWNECLKKASGEYFLLLSDDDLLYEDTIEKLHHPFVNQDISISYSKFVFFRKDLPKMTASRFQKVNKSYATENGKEFVLNFFLGQREIYPCGILFRVRDLRGTNCFPLSLKLASDALAWMKIILNNEKPVCFVANAVSAYRVHNNSQTNLAKNTLWLKEVADLQSFFESNLTNTDKTNFGKKWKNYQYRKSIKMLVNSKGGILRFVNFLKITAQIQPSMGEVFANLIRWFIPKEIWDYIKVGRKVRDK
jgi:glycosyltransferase involved in cell wall biosynthesis